MTFNNNNNNTNYFNKQQYKQTRKYAIAKYKQKDCMFPSFELPRSR